jgi:hypothetical protein
MLAGKLLGGWGVTWDIQWHVLIGRDSFWIAPHLMTYSAVTAVVVLCLAALGRETGLALAGLTPAGSLRVLGLVGSRGIHVAWWGIAATVAAAPIDDLWHRLFGLDVTLWSPPHLLGLLGNQVNSAGCLLLAVEVYPPANRARVAALLAGAAMFFGGFHLLLGTSVLWAYELGGLAFFLYPILGALLLPLALVPAARLSGQRWAPAFAVVLAAAIALAGGGVARLGFGLLAPEPDIAQVIAREPSSAIAKVHRMARENDAPVMTYTGRARSVAWALLPALALCLVDARRRGVPASLAFAGTYLAFMTWSLGTLPALQRSLPHSFDIAVGSGLALAAGAAGGYLGQRIAQALGTERISRHVPCRDGRATEAVRI